MVLWIWDLVAFREQGKTLGIVWGQPHLSRRWTPVLQKSCESLDHGGSRPFSGRPLPKKCCTARQSEGSAMGRSRVE